jgi:hypothetical protein
MTMGKFLYMAVQACSEGWISIGRIEHFLLLEDNKPGTVTTAATGVQQPQQQEHVNGSRYACYISDRLPVLLKLISRTCLTVLSHMALALAAHFQQWLTL